MRKPRNLTAALLCAFFLSCATNSEVYHKVDGEVAHSNFAAAAREIDAAQASRKPIYPAKNAVLLYLDKGMLEHYAENYAASKEALERAERQIEEAFTKSLTLEVGTYILNDNTREYAGEDFEDIYINVFNALNYYNSGDVNEALVEIRKINIKLRYLETKYAAAIEKAKNYAMQNGGYTEGKQEKYVFFDSALARYLASLFWRGAGKADDARIDRDAALAAYKLFPNVYPHAPPASMTEDANAGAGEARLDILAFSGLSPVKEENRIYVPLPFPFPNNEAKISLPVLKERKTRIERIEAVIDGEKRVTLELLEDMGAVYAETFKAREALVYAKTITRSIIKTSSAAITQIAVSSNEDSSGAGLLLGLFGRILNEASEAADTRGSRYFPHYAYLGGVNLAGGTHHVVVNFYAGSQIVQSVEKTVDVRENSLNLLEAVCLE